MADSSPADDLSATESPTSSDEGEYDVEKWWEYEEVDDGEEEGEFNYNDSWLDGVFDDNQDSFEEASSEGFDGAEQGNDSNVVLAEVEVVDSTKNEANTENTLPYLMSDLSNCFIEGSYAISVENLFDLLLSDTNPFLMDFWKQENAYGKFLHGLLVLFLDQTNLPSWAA